jgi:hypothetical protein
VPEWREFYAKKYSAYPIVIFKNRYYYPSEGF